MRKSVYDVVSEKVLEEVAYLRDRVVDGGCKDYVDYIHATAWITAANTLLEKLKEALVKIQKDEDTE